MSAQTPIALTIAGSDSGAGAGVQADLKTFAALGVYGAVAITALTAQNTRGVAAIHVAPPAIVAAQIEAVLADFEVAAIKIGMLASPEIVAAVAAGLRRTQAFVVYDPVMTASSGDALSGAGFREAVRGLLLPRVDCLTPNLGEAAALLGEAPAGDEAAMARQGAALRALGARSALMKGGHLDGAEAVDVLVGGQGVVRFAAPRLVSGASHGTGCTLSAAIAAHIVLGADLAAAVAAAKTFVGAAIERGAAARIGSGPGPLLQAPLLTR